MRTSDKFGTLTLSAQLTSPCSDVSDCDKSHRLSSPNNPVCCANDSKSDWPAWPRDPFVIPMLLDDKEFHFAAAPAAAVWKPANASNDCQVLSFVKMLPHLVSYVIRWCRCCRRRRCRCRCWSACKEKAVIAENTTTIVPCVHYMALCNVKEPAFVMSKLWW